MPNITGKTKLPSPYLPQQSKPSSKSKLPSPYLLQQSIPSSNNRYVSDPTMSSSSTLTSKLQHAGRSSLMSGAFAGVISRFIMEQDGSVNVYGVNIPVSILLASVVSISDFASTMITPYVINKISDVAYLSKYKSFEVGLVTFSIIGLSASGLLFFTTNQAPDIIRVGLLVGAFSYIGDAISYQILANSI